MNQTYDAIIIGAGQAGPALANRLTRSGLSVAVIERNRFGGTCVNTGCTPTKTLIASAKIAHQARHATAFGVHFGGDVSVDMREVKARKDAIVARSREGIEKWLRSMERCTVIQGHAQFESAHSIRVGDALISA